MFYRLKESVSKIIWTKCWTVGFVKGGLASVFNEDTLEVEWVNIPHDRWFADPFILDVSDNEISLLVEDFAYSNGKGVISLLKINRHNLRIINRKVLLDIPTHLSFPIIMRKNGHVYVYPENRQNKVLDLYEYNPKEEILTFCMTICDEEMWDSVIFDKYDETMLFTANTDDYSLNIYKWDSEKKLYQKQRTIYSNKPDMRMAGQFFNYKGLYYCPTQDCSRNYGYATVIREVTIGEDEISLKYVKTLYSPNKRMNLAFHTLNEYKGVVVVDAQGYRFPIITSIIILLSKIKKKLRITNG